MAPKKRAPQKSGGARLTASGKRPMMLGWKPEDIALIEEATEAQRINLGLTKLAMTEFVMSQALAVAKKILGK